MKLEIITTGEKIEKVNYLLSLAIYSAKYNKEFIDFSGMTEKDLEECELFRKQLLKGYFKHFKNNENIND